MDNMRGLTRKGPKRVWIGYKNLRVPEEIFPEVRDFMERRKLEYRAKKEGLSVEQIPATNSERELEERTRKILEQMLAEKNIGSGFINQQTSPQETKPSFSYARTLTSKEMVEEFLKQNPNQIFSNTQLSKQLGIPGPTLREATRTLAGEDERYVLISGRPNKIQFVS